MFSVVDANPMNFSKFIVMFLSLAMLLNGPAIFFNSKECMLNYYAFFMDSILKISEKSRKH